MFNWLEYLKITLPLLSTHGGAVRQVYLFNEMAPIEKSSIGGVTYHSQNYQDLFVDRVLFKQKEEGFFLDIGGNDPIALNNTYFFEKERKWSGLAFEPQKANCLKWSKRQTECMQIALGCEEKEMEFIEYEDSYRSGIAGSTDFNGKIKNKYKVKVRRLDNILREKNIKKVDYVSLDTEGYELDILKGINFDEVDIKSFSIELEDGKEARKVRKLLLKHGYKFAARLWQDDVWIKEV